MIISNIGQDYIPADDIRCILRHCDLSPEKLRALSPGKYNPDGEAWYYLIIEGETKKSHVNQPEFHKKYGDIQLVISGTETIEYSICAPSSEEFNTEETTADLFLAPSHETGCTVILKEGDYAVFFPGEIHKPMCYTEHTSCFVRKVVIKFPFKPLSDTTPR